MIPVVNDKFSCEQCGKCCTDLKNAFSFKPAEENLVFSLSDNPGLPLWEWEAEKIKDLSKKKNMKTKIEPLHFFHDKKSGQSIIVSFHLNHYTCAFYDGACSIYHKRPFSCRMFPMKRSMIFDFDVEQTVNLGESHCPNDRGKDVVKGKMNASGCAQSMRKYYSDSFDIAVQNDLVNYFIVKKIEEMVQNREIEPVTSKKEALEKFYSSRSRNFFAFLEERGYAARKVIENFLVLDQARSVIDSVINE